MLHHRLPLGSRGGQPRCSTSLRAAASGQPRASEDEYNRAMQAYSQSPFTYQHEAGLCASSCLPALVASHSPHRLPHCAGQAHSGCAVPTACCQCGLSARASGTQPRSAADVDRLCEEEGVSCIFNTQQAGAAVSTTPRLAHAGSQDKDMAHWGVDLGELRQRCAERNVLLERHPFPDFSGEGLRAGLPAAVCALDALLEAGHRVYLHCTAGMGRSPGVAIAYLYWLRGYPSLDSAYTALTSIRPCGPNKEAIRNASCDLLRFQGPLGTLPPPPAASWPEGDGVTLTDDDRRRITELLRAARKINR